MQNTFLIYLLSVAGPFADTLIDVSWWCAFLAVLVYTVSTIRHWIMTLQETDGFRTAGGTWNAGTKVINTEAIAIEKEAYKVTEPKVRKFTLVALTLALMMRVTSGLCPTTENVLKAYALIEGSKVINAPNAELAAEAVGKRFDKFLDIVDRGINSRHVQSTLTKTLAPAVPPLLEKAK